MKEEEQQSIFHYKLLKLSNGENIVCATDDDCQNLRSKTSIHICDPVLITPFRIPKGMSIAETFIMTPWISISDESVFEVPTEQILVAVDIKDNFKENYISFVESSNETSNIKVRLNDTERLVDTILNTLGKSNNEEIEDKEDRPIIVPGTRTIH